MKRATHYRQMKQAEARQQAIDWQRTVEHQNYSYSELAEWQDYFYNLARKYGLVREFKENGIL